MVARSNRSHSAENAARNKYAQSLGFRNRYEMRRARERGRFPSAKEIRTNPKIREMVAEKKTLAQQVAIARQKAQQSAPPAARPPARGADIPGRPRTAKERDKASRDWSRSYSRQARTAYDPSWGREQKDAYYNAFVRDWMVPNDERMFDDTYDYLIEYEFVDPTEFIDNPYKND